MKHFAQDLGFEYLSASTKEEFLKVVPDFTNPMITEKPIILEVFEDVENQDKALQLIQNIVAGNVKDQICAANNMIGKIMKKIGI